MILMTDEKKGVNPLATGVAGAMIGAAAAAAAIVLSDEKNRKKAENILKDLQKQGDKVLKEITKRTLELKDLSEKAISKTKAQPKKSKNKRKK